MISARVALLRQAQEYFHQYLLGVVKWDDVVVDKAIPVPAVNGHRDQGRVKDLVVAHFGGFQMELVSPFENDQKPLGWVVCSHAGCSVEGPLDVTTWVKVSEFIKQQKLEGEDNGSDVESRAAWGRRGR